MNNDNEFYKFQEVEMKNRITRQENKEKAFKEEVSFAIKIFIIGILYVIFLVNWISRIIVLTLAFVAIASFVIYNHIQRMKEFENECDKFKKRNPKLDGKFDTADLVKLKGEVYYGEVLHAKEYIDYDYDENGEIKNKDYYYDLVVKFKENDKEKYIVRRGFPYKLGLINASKDDIDEMYGKSKEDLEKFKEECVTIYEYCKDDVIAFENYGGNMKLYEYSDSIKKNFLEDYSCKIYKYANRYVVGDIEEYDYEGEHYRKEKIKEVRNEKAKKELFISIIFLILALILSGT